MGEGKGQRETSDDLLPAKGVEDKDCQQAEIGEAEFGTEKFFRGGRFTKYAGERINEE